VVMNSLLNYEGMAGQVQMIYMDPPYGIKFGSNFQPFVRKRDVKHGDDDHMTYEPEMVQAYRDTWELGLHSYLTYMRDRLLLARGLLARSGSIFVQIGDENLHHVREVMDEVFGSDNFCGVIAFKKTSGQSSALLANIFDFVLWYTLDKNSAKFRQLHEKKSPRDQIGIFYDHVELEDGTRRKLTKQEIKSLSVSGGARVFQGSVLYSEGATNRGSFPVLFEDNEYMPPSNAHWKTNADGMNRLIEKRRIFLKGRTLRYVRYFNDFPYYPLTNAWTDTSFGGFVGDQKKTYVVQTYSKVIERCLLMTTDPGDLVLDPTCGSGTTAYVAEQWGRRWITTDVSRVPLALARQRLLTATYKYYELRDESRGPVSGFVYKRKQNKKGEEIGGIVPHITLKSIAKNEPPAEEVLVDRPEMVRNITRVTGPFVVEATIPTPMDWEQEDTVPLEIKEDHAAFGDRMLEVLRKVKTLRLPGNRKVVLKNVRLPAKTLSLSAEAIANGENGGSDEISGKPVAFVFGPENGAVSEHLVFEAAREAHGKDYAHLFVLGFGIEPNARMLVEKCNDVMGIPATYVEATRDLMMGDLLKNMRSSQVFSVCGLPEVEINRDSDGKYQVKLLGVDVFDPVTMASDSRPGDDVPAWFLDTDYNAKVFHVCQAFFPRTSAWNNLKKAIKTDYSSDVWDHLAGDESAPFEGGDHGRIAVKVIDDRGNELMVVKDLKEVKQ